MADGDVPATERANKRRPLIVIIGVAAAIVIALILLQGGDDGSDTAKAQSPLSARIELADHSVAAGGVIDGQVILNNTGEALIVVGCKSIFQVALASDEVESPPAWPACAEDFTIPTGESSWPVTVRAHYLACAGEPVSEGLVPCEGEGGQPSLPPGDYEARLYQQPEEEVVPEPPPIQVRVVSDP